MNKVWGQVKNEKNEEKEDKEPGLLNTHGQHTHTRHITRASRNTCAQYE